ncbi:unnamed protein product [Phytophthora lilii]|uniref:Unnamed protein product n=1 Tax=Phytophthora lilii TaxID=2077276 RepID=A0A9W6X8Q1_9STRA|nr:unnamed protein product [Phytophthora lilii]
MHLLQDIVKCVYVIIVGLTAANVISSKIDGTVKLYSSPFYNDPLLDINIRYPNQCYNVDCSFLDNKVASAKWTGLPTTGTAGSAYIVFYEDFDCGGDEFSLALPHYGGIRDFGNVKLNGQISAFMVRSEGKLISNGFSNVCSWTGADVVGGSVSQDDSLLMVNATV